MFHGTYYPKQCNPLLSLWKETKFHNRIDSPAWRWPIDSGRIITLIVEVLETETETDDIS